MISAQNLLLNVAQVDASKDTQSGSPASSLNLTVDNVDPNKEDSQQNDALDPNAFMLLLSQVFANNAPEQAAAADKALDTKSDSDKQQASANDLTGANVNVRLNPMQADIQAVQETDTKQKDTTASAVALNQINDNPAVSWIDSSSFQSMASKDEAIACDKKTANVDASLLDNAPKASLTSALPTAMQAKNDAKASDPKEESAALLNTTNDKAKSDIMQSLQQLSAGIVSTATTETAKKTDSLTPDVLNAANNAQAMVAPNQPNHVAATQTKTLEIAVPVTDPQWNNKLSDHIVWLGQNEIKSAVIKIHPEELGPLQINIKVDKDMASVNIVSHSAQVRDIVDQALPRLRDMMAGQGVHLADVQVSADQRSNQFAQNSHGNNEQQHEHAASINDVDEDVQLVTSVKKGPKGLVDYFA